MPSRKAKIIATIGPSCQEKNMMRSMMLAGLDIARLNFSHGTHESHAHHVATIRELSQELDKPITILQDLQGPKLRVGDLPYPGVELTAGQMVELSTMLGQNALEGLIHIPLDVPEIEKCVHPGNRILLDDGNLELEVVEVTEQNLLCRVILGGLLRSHKGVNLPGAKLSIPGFTEKDRADLEFGLSLGIDLLAISFVSSPEDIELVRNTIKTLSPGQADLPIIAKLERPEAIGCLDEIIQTADGVMVARGDLAVETTPAVVPTLQKEIIRSANQHAKYVITATQMLDSMIHNPRPTRAEASDVANAVFDGTDAVMLSGETASGEYPLESIIMMANIVEEAEKNSGDWGFCGTISDAPTQDDAVSMTRAARELAQDRNVAAIVVFTRSGKTALLMSKARPQVPIQAFTPEESTYRRLGMYWGVTPYHIPCCYSVEDMIQSVESNLLESQSIQNGQQIVLLSSLPVGAMRPPNFAFLHTIGKRI